MADLFSQIQIRNVNLGNRILMPPLAVKNSETTGFVNDIVIGYYREMSKLGMGLVITENSFVTNDSRVMPNQLLLSDDEFINGHKKLVDSIHQNSVPVACEINHAGSDLYNIPELMTMLSNKDESNFVVESVKMRSLNSISEGDLPKEHIVGIIHSFGNAARRAVSAGYDMVEIHAAHGFLINQFLSPIINGRKDEYGGNLANRARILIEIIEEVRSKIGEVPIIVRFPLSDNPPQFTLCPGGFEIEDGLEIAHEISLKGIDMIDVSGGYSGSRPRELNQIEGYYSSYSEAIKEKTKSIVNVTGGIKRPEFANYLIKSGKADTVGIGRALLSDREWIIKAKKLLVGT